MRLPSGFSEADMRTFVVRTALGEEIREAENVASLDLDAEILLDIIDVSCDNEVIRKEADEISREWAETIRKK
jgi:hypothetical protein